MHCFFSPFLLAQNTPPEKARYTRHKLADISFKVDTYYQLVSSRNFFLMLHGPHPHNHLFFFPTGQAKEPYPSFHWIFHGYDFPCSPWHRAEES